MEQETMSLIRRVAATAGLTGVALGAFGAHGLRSVLEANHSLETWKTASLYHLIHSVVMLWISAQPARSAISFACFGFGTLIFSGSLYLLALTQVRWLGAVTPAGGVLLMLGWIALMFGSSERKS